MEIGPKALVPAFAAILLVIGVLGTTYQVAMLRVYPILLDEGKVHSTRAFWLDQDHQLGQRTYAFRSAYNALDGILPADAVIQYNPNAVDFVPHQLYSAHDAAMGLPKCGANFGGDISRCEGRIQSVEPLFKRPSASASADLDNICRKYGIDAMVVDDSDPVWKQRDSWAWTRKPLLANSHVRAFACGDAEQRVHFASASSNGNAVEHPGVRN